jgi:hypothetical protein
VQFLGERVVEIVVYVWLGSGYIALGVFWILKALRAGD